MRGYYDDDLAPLTSKERARLRNARKRSDCRDVQLDILRSLYGRARAKLAVRHGIADLAAFEAAADELLATMQRCVAEMGGSLRYTAEFRKGPSLVIPGLSAFGAEANAVSDLVDGT